MPLSKERKDSPVPAGVEVRPETPEIPEHIEKDGVRPTPSQFTAQVKGNKGQQLIQTPSTKTVTIQLPADQTTLVGWSKGSVADSITWLGMFWLRMIKKAFRFGWRVIAKPRKN